MIQMTLVQHLQGGPGHPGLRLPLCISRPRECDGLHDPAAPLCAAAEVYGFGLSEELVGEFLKETGSASRVKVATKFAPLPWRVLNPAEDVVSACRASLARLQLDSMALYIQHWPGEGAGRLRWRCWAEAGEVPAAHGAQAHRCAPSCASGTASTARAPDPPELPTPDDSPFACPSSTGGLAHLSPPSPPPPPASPSVPSPFPGGAPACPNSSPL